MAFRLQSLLLRARLIATAIAVSVPLALVGDAANVHRSATLGVYVGGGNTGGFDEFVGSLGVRPAFALDYLSDESWGSIESPQWELDDWNSIGVSDYLSVPMLPSSGASLAKGAGGAYDSHFSVLAKALVNAGDGDGVVRLGWELNGNWYPWSAGGQEAAFVAYWRQIVTTMRAVSPGFRFDWCVANGSSTAVAEAAYPGDEYVDYVGDDTYDQSWVADRNVFANRWSGYVHGESGLAWQRSFAAAHGKQVTIPEWGLMNGEAGAGDDPQFIQSMYEWMKESNLAFEAYFDFEASALGQYPKSEALYNQLFG